MEMETLTSGPPVVQKTGCCEPFDPEPWRDVLIRWDDKPFIRRSVRAFLHIPIGIGKTVVETMKAIEAAGVMKPDMKMLARGKSPWKTELLFETTGPVPAYPLERLSGTFFAKVFDGPWRDAGTWHQAAEKDARARGFDVDESHVYEMWTTCPSCAKAYGHNWVVILERVREPA